MLGLVEATKLGVQLLVELRRIADALERISPPNVSELRRPAVDDERPAA